MNIDEHRCPPRAFLEEIFAKPRCGIRCVDDNLPRPCWYCLPKHRQCGHRKAQNPLAPQSSQLRRRPSATLRPGINLQKSRRDTLNDDTMTKCPSVQLGLNSCVPHASHCKSFFHFSRVSSVTMEGPQYWLASSLSCTELAWRIALHLAT